MSAAVSHHGGCVKWPAMISVASRAAHAANREIQRLAAIASSTASATFMQSSQRKGSCTNRNLGKCCHSKPVNENMINALAAPQLESSIHGLALTDAVLPATGPANAVSARVVRCRYETTMANTRTMISAIATDETRRLKRL